jgi:hypothetical protein
MKRIIKLIIILSVFTQIVHAQTIETVEAYKALYDSIVPQLKLAEQEANSCIDKPFSKFVELLDTYGVKIIEVGMIYDSRQLYPQEVFGVRVMFISNANRWFGREHDLVFPIAFIYFNESKPYEEALRLLRKYNIRFSEEVEDFYSDASIKSIKFEFLNSMYGRDYRNN